MTDHSCPNCSPPLDCERGIYHPSDLADRIHDQMTDRARTLAGQAADRPANIPAERDLVGHYLADRAAELMLARHAAALADLDQVGANLGSDVDWATYVEGTHTADCWRWHADCLAARIRRTLIGEDTPDA